MTAEAIDDSPAPVIGAAMLEALRRALQGLLAIRCDPGDPAWLQAALAVAVFSQCNQCGGHSSQECVIPGGGIHISRCRRARRQGQIRPQDMEALEALACECGIVAGDRHQGTPCAVRAIR